MKTVYLVQFAHEHLLQARVIDNRNNRLISKVAELTRNPESPPKSLKNRQIKRSKKRQEFE